MFDVCTVYLSFMRRDVRCVCNVPPCLWDLMHDDDVEDTIVHMCRFGLTASDADGEGLVKKPTRVISNLPFILLSTEYVECCHPCIDCHRSE